MVQTKVVDSATIFIVRMIFSLSSIGDTRSRSNVKNCAKIDSIPRKESDDCSVLASHSGLGVDVSKEKDFKHFGIIYLSNHHYQI